MRFEHRLPTPAEFMALRMETNWGVPDKVVTETLLKRSFSGIVAFEDDKLIGIARTVGDGCVILYIQDVIITASHRSQGIGLQMIKTLLNEAAKTCLPECTVGLFAAIHQDGFYSKLGFSQRNKSDFGPAMQTTFSDLAKADVAA